MDGESPLAQLKTTLRRARHDQRLTMDGLESRARISHTTASQALNPGATIPTEATVVALARALRLDPDPLLALRAQAQAELLVAASSAPTGEISDAAFRAWRRRAAQDSAKDRAQAVLLQGMELAGADRHQEAIPLFERSLDILEGLVKKDSSLRAAHAMAEFLLGDAISRTLSKELGREFMIRAHITYSELLEEEAVAKHLLEYIRTNWHLVDLTVKIGDDLEAAEYLAHDALTKTLKYIEVADEKRITDSETPVGEVVRQSVACYAIVLKKMGRMQEVEKFLESYNSLISGS